MVDYLVMHERVLRDFALIAFVIGVCECEHKKLDYSSVSTHATQCHSIN